LGIENRAYKKCYDPGTQPIAHLLFALKHEGPNPHYLSALFQQADLCSAILDHIQQAPTGIWPRRLWFWYEWLSDKSLPLDDCKAVPYQEVIDSSRYYTAEAINLRRYCLRNNVPGTKEMIPLVRRTDGIEQAADQILQQKIHQQLAGFDRQLIERAARYLISSETKSSSEIEGENLAADEQMRFCQAIEHAEQKLLDLDTLINIQCLVRDPRYAEQTFRTEQNYAGGAGFGAVSLVTPKPEDAHSLMDNWYALYQRLASSSLPMIVQAAVLSSQYIYIHPFMDGNGRVSRYLIQDIIARSGLMPDGL
jgi:hypothetical protein